MHQENIDLHTQRFLRFLQGRKDDENNFKVTYKPRFKSDLILFYHLWIDFSKSINDPLRQPLTCRVILQIIQINHWTESTLIFKTKLITFFIEYFFHW